MNSYAQGPSSLVLEKTIRVYFSCRPLPDSQGRFVSYSSWVELDRKDPTRIVAVANTPILNLGDKGTFDEFGTYPSSVIPYEEGYRAYYGGWTRCESVPFDVAIGLAESKDGRIFQRVGPGPVLGRSASEPFILSGPKIRKFNDQYILFYIAGRRWLIHAGRAEPVYKIRMALSRDGIQWKIFNQDLIPDSLGPDEAQASPDVTYSSGKYHMFFCYRAPIDYRRNKSNTYRIGYAWSTDLETWNRDDAQAGLSPSKNGWDSEMVAYPHIAEIDGDTFLFYLGNLVGKQGFGLAKLKGKL